MKTFFAFMTALVLVAAVERPAHAGPTVSVDVFYDALAPFGDWVDVEGYGYCFRPSASVDDPDWRPYTDGSWVYTDAGWTWDSDEPFAWATYHYGRWFLLGDTWFWRPGQEWAPAWVSWRTSDEYVGWAPLPPEAEWQPDVGFGTYVDIDYDIGPRYYSFVPVHYLGERRLRQWIEPWHRNVQYMRVTENRTHITYRNSESRVTSIYNEGPDYTVYSRRAEHPIRRLTLAEQNAVDLRDRSTHLRNTIQSDRFSVIAPTVQRVGDREAAPRAVAHHFDRSHVYGGWEGYRDEDVRDLRTKYDTVRREANREVKRSLTTDRTSTNTSANTTATDRTRTSTADRTASKEKITGREGASSDRTGVTTTEKVTGREGATADRTGVTTTDKTTGREGATTDRMPKAQPGVSATGKRKPGESTTADRIPKALPPDSPTADRESADRNGVNSETSRKGLRPGDSEQLRKAVPVTPGRNDDERTRIQDQPPKGKMSTRDGDTGGNARRAPTESEQLRKAVPVTPGRGIDENGPGEDKGRSPGKSNEIKKAVPATPGDEKPHSRADNDQPRKGKAPGSDLAPGNPDRFRVEPQDTPPRSQTKSKPGINRPEDNPPGPPRGVVPGEGGNTQRKITPDTDRGPKMKPGPGGPDGDNVPHAKSPNIEPPTPQPQPEARKVEPRNIAPPEPKSPKVSPRVAPPASAPPPQVLERPPGKPVPPGQKGDDDEKKRKKASQ